MNFPVNPKLKECLKTESASRFLDELDVPAVYSHPVVFETNDNNIFYSIPKLSHRQNWIAAFDVDWTLAYSEKHLFPKGPSDIHILPHRIALLVSLFKKGYTLVLFTNQNAATKETKTNRVARIAELVTKLKLPCYAFVATVKESDAWKPGTGMWSKFLEISTGLVNMNHSFYVGDAQGRPQDFSDADKMFAMNIGLKTYTPEEVFAHTVIPKSVLKREKTMLIFVGMPGSGKSSYYAQHLAPLGYTHVEQDTLKTKPKVIKAVEQAVERGESIAIDATNPKKSDREVYYRLADEAGYNVAILYFLRDGYGWNKLRESSERKKVPDVVYHLYFKNLDSPREDGRKVYEITI